MKTPKAPKRSDSTFRTLASFVTLLSQLFSAVASVRSAGADPAPVAIWHADGSAQESVHGLSAVSSTAGYRPGKLGQAFEFDGAGRRIEYGDPEFLRFTNHFSFEFWAYVNDNTPFGGGQTLVFRGDSRPGLDPYAIAVGYPHTLLFVVVNASGQATTVSAEIPLKAWVHVAAVFSDGRAQLYLNGALVGEVQGSVYPFATLQGPSGFALGNTISSNNFPFGGLMDEVAAYDYALSAEQVRRLYALGGFKHCPDPSELDVLSPEFIASLAELGCLSVHQARGTPQVVNGFVVGVTLTDPGFGYTNAPLVKLIGGGGTGATASAVVSNGVVVAINIDSPGKGYTETPRVLIASPWKLPSATIRTTRVAVDLSLVLGHRYQLFTSRDLSEWTPAESGFVAEDETLTREFDTGPAPLYFRVLELR